REAPATRPRHEPCKPESPPTLSTPESRLKSGNPGLPRGAALPEPHSRERPGTRHPLLDAVEGALRTGPGLLEAGAREGMGRARESLLRGALLPAFTLRGEAAREERSWPGGRLGDGTRLWEFEMRQSLYDARARGESASAVHQGEALRQEKLRAAQVQIREVVSVYAALYGARGQLRLSGEHEERIAAHLRATRRRFEAGELTLTDVTQAEVRLAAAETARIQASRREAALGAEYRAVTGASPPEELPEAKLAPVDPGPGEDRAGVRPDLLAARSEVFAAACRRQGADRNRLPLIGLRAGYGQNWAGASSGLPGPATDRRVGIEVEIPLYSGGSLGAEAREAAWDETLWQARLAGREREVARDLEVARQRFEEAREVCAAQERAAALAAGALDAVGKEFAAGTRTALDVLDAQEELFAARRQLLDAHSAILLGEVDLLLARGRLDSEELERRLPLAP
ncbi:MAG: TolC family protein, partial [Planctomycetes bacterium]|nr:TolC family protein [Planctomycetota bacterium]